MAARRIEAQKPIICFEEGEKKGSQILKSERNENISV